MTSPLKSDLFTDKPISLSVKEYLIRRMAVKMRMSEKVLEAVVNHQFQSANEAMSQHKSLEISGFGKLFFNEKKAQKTMEKFLSQKALFEKKANDEALPEAKRRNASMKLQSALDNIRDLKPRIYDFSDLRGVEEQPAAAQKVEEQDNGNE
jgi:nucleoid DNA-binding protein